MRKLRFLVEIFLIAILTGGVFYLASRSGYLALSGDGYAHATKIKFITDFWPKVNWVYFWGAGLPVFLWYGFMPYFFLVGFASFFSSASLAIGAVNWLTFFLIGLAVYGLVYEATRHRLSALLAVVLTIPSPGLWYRILVGTTSRTFGDAWLMLSAWLLVRCLRKNREENLGPMEILGLIFATSMAFQAHFFITLMTICIDSWLILLIGRNWRERIYFGCLTFLPAFLVAAYFLIPYVLTGAAGGASGAIGFYEAAPLDLKLLFYHPPEELIQPGGGLMALSLPLLLAFLPAAILSGAVKEKPFAMAVLRAFLGLFFVFLVFGTAIYFGYPANRYNIGFVPDEAFEYLSLVLPVGLGILFWLVIPKKGWGIFFGLMVLISGGVTVWQYPARYSFRTQIPWHSDPQAVYDQDLFRSFLAGQEEEKNFRYAHPATEVSLWFNYLWQIPQNREFFPHGVMYPNWRSWQENALWNPEWDERPAETKFLLDWFGIRWFSLLPPSYNLNIAKYQADEDYSPLAASAGGDQVHFQYEKATPILATNEAPAFLVVGEDREDRAYGPLIRLLATRDWDSRTVIPVRGETILNSQAAKSLADFPLVVMYEYGLKDPQADGLILKEYLDGGGKAIIEMSGFVNEEERHLFESGLGFETEPVELAAGQWRLTAGEDRLGQVTDLSLFSPPVFEGATWKVRALKSAVDEASITPILYENGRPVVFRLKVGQGELIWSGLNLPYHALSYRNQTETDYFLAWLKDLLPSLVSEWTPVSSGVVFISPQERQLILSETAKGVLFKENYFPNWQAFLTRDGEQENLKIYRAGPDFMYVFLPPGVVGAVSFVYTRSWLEKGCTILSIFSFLLILGLITSGRFWGRGGNQVLASKNRLLVLMKGWWERDEES